MTMRHLLAVLCSVQLVVAPIAHAADPSGDPPAVAPDAATSNAPADHTATPTTATPSPGQNSTTTGDQVLTVPSAQKGPNVPPGTPATPPPLAPNQAPAETINWANYPETMKCYNGPHNGDLMKGTWTQHMGESNDKFEMIRTFVDARDQEGIDRIESQLHEHKSLGCAAVSLSASTRPFYEGMVELYEQRKTEGVAKFNECPGCSSKYRSQLSRLVDSGKAIGECAGQPGGICNPTPTQPLPPLDPVGPPPRPPVAVRPVPLPPEDDGGVVEEERPVRRHHPRHEDHDDDDGGNHSFLNSNLMWGLGGLAIGGVLGYMFGKNSQPQYQFPYGGQMYPGLMRPMGPLGQVPGGAYAPWGSPFGYNSSALPYRYPVGQPFGGGYGGGIGGGYGLGVNTGFSSPIYNGFGGGGTYPPSILPYYH